MLMPLLVSASSANDGGLACSASLITLFWQELIYFDSLNVTYYGTTEVLWCLNAKWENGLPLVATLPHGVPDGLVKSGWQTHT